MNKAWARKRERIKLYHRCVLALDGKGHDWKPEGQHEKCSRCTSIRFVKRDAAGTSVHTEIAP